MSFRQQTATVLNNIYEPAHDKTYNKTCVTSKDSDQPVHPSSMARVLVHPCKDSGQTARMRRLTAVFAGRKSLIIGFVDRWLNYIRVDIQEMPESRITAFPKKERCGTNNDNMKSRTNKQRITATEKPSYNSQ